MMFVEPYGDFNLLDLDNLGKISSMEILNYFFPVVD